MCGGQIKITCTMSQKACYSVNVPKGLTNVSNGRLVGVDEMSFYYISLGSCKSINNYGVNINIGDYVNFSEIYKVKREI